MMKCEIIPIAALFVNLDNLSRVPTQTTDSEESAIKRLATIAPGIERSANLIFYASGHFRPEAYFFSRTGVQNYPLREGCLLNANIATWREYFRLRPSSALTHSLRYLVDQYENRNS